MQPSNADSTQNAPKTTFRTKTAGPGAGMSYIDNPGVSFGVSDDDTIARIKSILETDQSTRKQIEAIHAALFRNRYSLAIEPNPKS